MPSTHNSKFNKWTLVKASMPSDLVYDIEDLITFFCGHGPRLSEGFPATPAMVPVLTRKDRDDLNPFLSFAKSVGFQPPIDVDQRLKDMQFGGGGEKGIHATQIAVEASLLNKGWETLKTLPNACGKPRVRQQEAGQTGIGIGSEKPSNGTSRARSRRG
jgi:hypothetical protein